MNETLDLQVSPLFDGRFEVCSQLRLFRDRYIPCAEIPCSGHRRLYLACLAEHIIGGRLDGTGRVVRERLRIYLLTNGVDVFPREIFMRDALLGARFFWIGAEEVPSSLRQEDKLHKFLRLLM